MNRFLKVPLFLLCCIITVSCGKKNINIEKAFVEQTILEFTEERMAYYLHGGAPKANAEILEKVLSRHSVKLIEFKPALRRFFPEIHTRILGA